MVGLPSVRRELDEVALGLIKSLLVQSNYIFAIELLWLVLLLPMEVLGSLTTLFGKQLVQAYNSRHQILH